MVTSKNFSSELLGLEKLQAFTNSQRDMQGKAVQTAGDGIGMSSNMASAIAISTLTKNPAAEQNEVLDAYISRTYDPDAAPATAQELVDTVGLSVAASIILGGIPGKTNTDTNINTNTNAQPNVGKSSLSGASPNATMTAKGGMQNGQAESGRGHAVPRNGQSNDGGLGAGADAGNPGVGDLGGGGIPGWQPLRGQRETSAGVLESSAGNQGEPDRQGSAARGGNPGLVPGSGIPEITKRLKAAGTAVVDDNGDPILLTHWTPNMDFTEFGEGDVGFHFGSRAQAEERARKQGSDKNTGRYIQAYLNIKNPVHMPTDQYGWNAAQAAITLWNQGIIPFEEYKRIERMAVEDRGRYNAESSKALRDLLESYGYDGIVYENEFEGEGKSYVAFHPERGIWIDDGTGPGGDTGRPGPTGGPQLSPGFEVR